MIDRARVDRMLDRLDELVVELLRDGTYLKEKARREVLSDRQAVDLDILGHERTLMALALSDMIRDWRAAGAAGAVGGVPSDPSDHDF